MAGNSNQVTGSIRTLALTEDEFQQPLLRRLYAYWNALRAGRPWPRRQDLRPEEIVFALPYIALIEAPATEEPGLRIRLVGEEIRNELVGYVKGARIEDIQPDWYRDHLVERYRAVLASGKPSFEAVRVVYDIRDYYYHRLILPMSVSGDAPDMLLVATIYTPPHAYFASPADHLG
jgi:hypothetical protein